MSENRLIGLLGASPLLPPYAPAHPDVSTSQGTCVVLCLVSVPRCKLLGRMTTWNEEIEGPGPNSLSGVQSISEAEMTSAAALLSAPSLLTGGWGGAFGHGWFLPAGA